MVTKRILIFGGHSQIGKAMSNQQLPADWECRMLDRAACDFMQGGAIGRAIQDFKPDLVVNAAAMTDIDACERDKDRAMYINFDSVAAIASQCVACDAPMIQISTDYVFDGNDGDIPYVPDAPMNPLNVYGQSKMMGEEAVRHGLYWHVILRTSLVFSAHGDNVLTKTLRAIDTQDEFGAVTDQVANPTSAQSLALGLIKISDAILDGAPNCFGTFHLCDEPAVTRYEFLQAIIDAYAPYSGRRPNLVGLKSGDIPNRVPRPGFTALDCEKTRDVYGIVLRPWRDDLAAAIKQYVDDHASR